mmetsp:Transcript_19258/g.62033  ORF Transcript_19258/g.62033 Transcript_19258/m.62033 type:complete len:636 (+) Transcript_19258:587-2494(+)
MLQHRLGEDDLAACVVRLANNFAQPVQLHARHVPRGRAGRRQPRPHRPLHDVCSADDRLAAPLVRPGEEQRPRLVPPPHRGGRSIRLCGCHRRLLLLLQRRRLQLLVLGQAGGGVRLSPSENSTRSSKPRLLLALPLRPQRRLLPLLDCTTRALPPLLDPLHDGARRCHRRRRVGRGPRRGHRRGEPTALSGRRRLVQVVPVALGTVGAQLLHHFRGHLGEGRHPAPQRCLRRVLSHQPLQPRERRSLNHRRLRVERCRHRGRHRERLKLLLDHLCPLGEGLRARADGPHVPSQGGKGARLSRAGGAGAAVRRVDVGVAEGDGGALWAKGLGDRAVDGVPREPHLVSDRPDVARVALAVVHLTDAHSDAAEQLVARRRRDCLLSPQLLRPLKLDGVGDRRLRPRRIVAEVRRALARVRDECLVGPVVVRVAGKEVGPDAHADVARLGGRARVEQQPAGLFGDGSHKQRSPLPMVIRRRCRHLERELVRRLKPRLKEAEVRHIAPPVPDHRFEGPLVDRVAGPEVGPEAHAEVARLGGRASTEQQPARPLVGGSCEERAPFPAVLLFLVPLRRRPLTEHDSHCRKRHRRGGGRRPRRRHNRRRLTRQLGRSESSPHRRLVRRSRLRRRASAAAPSA